MDDEEQQALSAWGEKVIELCEPEVVDAILKAVRRMARKQNLETVDREFAQAQVRSILEARKKIGKTQ